MKLRNKKTGKTFELPIVHGREDEAIEIWVIEKYEDCDKLHRYGFKCLAELNEEWEDA